MSLEYSVLFKQECEKYEKDMVAYNEKLRASGIVPLQSTSMGISEPPSQAVSDIMDFDLPSNIEQGESTLGLESEAHNPDVNMDGVRDTAMAPAAQV